MSDSDELDIDGGESPDAGAGKKKGGGALGALLPTILKFAAIGLGALIFIVTVCVITIKVVSGGGKSQTVVADPSSPYIGKRPIYSYYTGVGQITTKTRDTNNYSVRVEMNIGYDQEDAAAASELSTRQYELRDFVRSYFTGKYASELQPENEARLKQDIKEILNTRFLDTGKVRIIVFDKLDVMEAF
ncbi:MAG: flagellar basal body-associated FliL family protein [Treponema sp.]|jgi:flagellar FliL protein|nr:flagellar basal body-associated FliL family protein [Treponema sp.]